MNNLKAYKYKIIAGLNVDLAIKTVLRDNPDGKNIRMVAEAIGVSKLSAKKYLNKLLTENKIVETIIGRSKVYRIGKS